MRSALFLLPLALSLPPEPSVEVHFAPTGGARRLEAEISGELRRAERDVRVAMFHFTSRRLVRALAARRRAGRRVRVLLDARQADPAFVATLRKGGLDVRRVTPRGSERTSFHHKFCVLDDRIVLTGSYNWTVMGDIANHENLLILRDARTARAYVRAFDRVWDDESLSRP